MDQVLDMILAMNELGKEERGNVIPYCPTGQAEAGIRSEGGENKGRAGASGGTKDIGALTTAYLTVNYALPVEIAAKSLRSRVLMEISVDERSSLVIYTDYPARIETARNLLTRLDRATSQVMIEARIVTATQEITMLWAPSGI